MIIYRKNIFSRKSLKPTFLFKWTSVSLFSRRLFLLFFVQRRTMLCRRKTFFKSLIVVGQKTTESSFLQHKRLEGTKRNPAGILLDPAWGEHLGERDPALMADCLSRFTSENWADFFQILSLQSLFFKFSFSSTSLTAKIKMQDFNTLVPNSKPKNNSTDEQVIPQTFPARKHLQPPPSLHPPQSNASYFGFLPFSSVCVSAPEQRGASWRSSGRLACRLFYRCCFLMHRLYTDRVMRWWWGGVFVEECVDRGGVPADRGDGPLDLTGLVPQLRFPLFSLLTAAEDPTRVLLLFFFVFGAPPRRIQRKVIKAHELSVVIGPVMLSESSPLPKTETWLTGKNHITPERPIPAAPTPSPHTHLCWNGDDECEETVLAKGRVWDLSAMFWVEFRRSWDVSEEMRNVVKPTGRKVEWDAHSFGLRNVNRPNFFNQSRRWKITSKCTVRKNWH